MPAAEPFWDFSLRIYAMPEVGAACLAIQDRFGADVNVILFCCWFGVTRGPLGGERLARALAFARPWSGSVTKPLRSVRRHLKDHPALPGAGDGAERLRQVVKKAELDSERIQQQVLEAACADAAPRAADARVQAADCAANLRGYCETEGIDPAAAGVHLAVIITAAIPGLETGVAQELLSAA